MILISTSVPLEPITVTPMPTVPTPSGVLHVLANQVSVALEHHVAVRKELAILLIHSYINSYRVSIF